MVLGTQWHILFLAYRPFTVLLILIVARPPFPKLKSYLHYRFLIDFILGWPYHELSSLLGRSHYLVEYLYQYPSRKCFYFFCDKTCITTTTNYMHNVNFTVLTICTVIQWHKIRSQCCVIITTISRSFPLSQIEILLLKRIQPPPNIRVLL